MPIIIKDWFWSQTAEEVKIVLTFKTPKNRSNVDILTSQKYLKLHSAPYFWECFLSHDIKDQESKCQIFDGKVQLTLKKLEPNITWESLEKDLTFEDKAAVREEALKINQENFQQQLKETIRLKEEKKKEEIMVATARDAQARQDYERMMKDMTNKFKDSMKNKMATLESIDEEQSAKNPPATHLVSPACIVDNGANRTGTQFEPETKQSLTQGACSKNLKIHDDDPTSVSFFKPKKPLYPDIEPPPIEEMAPIRPYGEVKIKFTPRRFITPKRESRSEDENEWLLKQKEIRKAMGFDEDELLPEEKNPDWLKRKGDQFFEQKNFRAAVAAYTAGIKLTDKWHDLYMNRSAAHFQLENYQRCIEDTTRALELLVPECEANLEGRKNCLARRGAALCRVGFIKQAYDEILAALKLDPGDAVLRRDAEMLRCKLERGD